MRFISFCAAALLLAGCADSKVSPSSGLFGGGSSAAARPKTIVVSDFTVSSDVVVIDRSFTARLERKIGAFPTHERKQRTVERVSDEIVATIVATLREAGLDAEPGSEEGVSLADNAAVVHGRLRPGNPAAKKNETGIGGGHSGVVADMTLSSSSRFGRKQLLAFVAEPAGGRKGGGAKATDALIAAALVAVKAAPEKLSPDVQVAARALGRSAGDKIVAYAKAQGWLDKPEVVPSEETKPEASRPAEAAPAVETAPEAMAPKPGVKPGAKPAQKPAA
jgi:hypothetical protein